MKSVIITSHKFLQQPDDDLVLYLTKNKHPDVMQITHSFPDAPDRISKYTWLKAGKIYRTEKSFDYISFPELLVYVKEALCTFHWVFTSRKKWDLYIGMDGFCTLLGLILKSLKKVEKVVYWSMDFVPAKRFKGRLGRLKDWIYHRVNKFGYVRCDEMWDISPRMKEAREKFLGINRNAYKIHKVVPFGVWWKRIRRYSYEECEKETLVFMGHLLEKQGVQLVIKVLPKLVKIFPNIKFKIIGTGKFKENLVKLSKDLGVYKRCVFMGEILDHRDLEKEISKCAVAVAPYIKKLDTWTYYADPGKVKVYLACGVPVVMTSLPWNSKDIEKNKCGFLVGNSLSNLNSVIVKALDPKLNQLYRDAAGNYSRSFDYAVIFDKLILHDKAI